MSADAKIAIGALDATARGVRLHIGLTLDYVRLNAANGTVGIDPFGFQLKEPAQVEVGIGENSLGAFLNALAPAGLQDFRVRFQAGKVLIDAVKRVLVAVPARAVCSLRLVDETKVFVDVEEVQMLGAGVKELVQGQLDQMNPIVDVAQFPIQMRIHEIVVDDGAVILRGTATA
jgi:hypothetical protein